MHANLPVDHQFHCRSLRQKVDEDLCDPGVRDPFLSGMLVGPAFQPCSRSSAKVIQMLKPAQIFLMTDGTIDRVLILPTFTWLDTV